MAPQILFFFFMMLLVGGVAVDLMRFEAKRVALQQTMDRATLAAASLENTLVPEDVVNSYFEAANLESSLKSITVTETGNGRTVRALATATSKNYFMSMMEVPYLEADNRSEAQQSINDIEIMLVLDVSGSMGGAKIANLKIAANDFIDTITENDPEGRISIGVIPYNAQVSIPDELRARFSVAYPHGIDNANCFELPSGVFSSLALPTSGNYPMMAIADVVSSTSGSSSYVTETGSSAVPVDSSARRWCNPSTDIEVTLPTKDKPALHSAIDDLVASGNTSILLGMRWATALLDPSARTLYQQMIGQGLMSNDMGGRPYEYDSKDAMKVIVLMTDGQHVAHNRVVDAFKGNVMSPIYRSRGDGKFSIYHNRANTSYDYWVPHRNSGAGEWRTSAWNSGSGVDQQTWQQVWSRVRVSWVAWQLYARALGTSSSSRNSQYNSAMNAILDQYKSVVEMDQLLSTNCALARNAGVLVYGIAFEAPEAGSAAIKDCASKPSSTYFFDADGLEIQTAFQLIASNLSQLRLTQ